MSSKSLPKSKKIIIWAPIHLSSMTSQGISASIFCDLFSMFAKAENSFLQSRQAFGLDRVQILLYLVPHALLFLSWFVFLSAAPFFLLTRARTWGRLLGAVAPEKVTNINSFGLLQLKMAPCIDLFWFVEVVERYNCSASFSAMFVPMCWIVARC